MHVTIIGSGYVGLVTGVCLADTGNDVVCLDIDNRKVQALSEGRPEIFEPGLEELLRSNLAAKRIRFTTDLQDAVAGTDVIFIAIGTPPKQDGSADLSGVLAVAEQLGKVLDHPTVVVTKSTVPVGTGDEIESLLKQHSAHAHAVVSNPEFLKEGSAVDDFFRPDRVVIGSNDALAAEKVSQLYAPFVRNQKPIYIMARRAAEMTKYAANAYLAMRISFINEIANVCDQLGIDVDEVRRGIGSDARVGHHFLYPGCGYGGSCFPKDVQAIAAFSRQAGYDAQLLEAVHQVNERQKHVLFDKISSRFAGQLSGKRIAVWGGAFKPKTDDIREAPAAALIERLLAENVTVCVHDPQALDNLQVRFGSQATYASHAYDAIDQADALAVVTEWNEFRSPDFERLKQGMRQPIIFDGRNLFDSAMLEQLGFEHYPIGRPATPR